MCELSVMIAQKSTVSSASLSPCEQVIRDIMWIDTEVSANGFDGWLYSTQSDRIVSTVDALSRVGCTEVAGITTEAISVIGFDPSVTSDSAKEALLDLLSEEQADHLSELSDEYCDAVEGCMETCKAFVAANRASFSLNETPA